MKVKNLLVVGVLSLLFLIVSFFYAESMISHGEKYKNKMHEHVEVLNFEERLMSSEEWLAILFNSDYEWEKKREASQLKLNEANLEYEEAINEAKALIIISVLFLCLVIILYLRGEYFRKAMAGSLLALSIAFLYVGIYTPMLELSAYSENLTLPVKVNTSLVSAPISEGMNYLNELAEDYIGIGWGESKPADYDLYEKDYVFKGKTYYFHQSKSIMELIKILFKDKNYVVAWAILSFSVLLPLMKIILTVMITFIKSLRKEGPFLVFVKIVGKWSMADVFVAASFLVYLSFNNMNVGVENESKVLFGLYFFLAYVIISITASIFVWLAIRRSTKLKLYEIAL